MGLGSFLLQIVQLQAVAQGFSTNLYLQANMSTKTVVYYKICGFKMAERNDPTLVPDSIQYWLSKSKDKNEITPFVYFVTTAELGKDALEKKEDPNAAEICSKFLHLNHLEGLLKIMGTSKDVNEKEAIECCLPNLPDNHIF